VNQERPVRTVTREFEFSEMRHHSPMGWLMYGVLEASFLRWSRCFSAAKEVARRRRAVELIVRWRTEVMTTVMTVLHNNDLRVYNVVTAVENVFVTHTLNSILAVTAV